VLPALSSNTNLANNFAAGWQRSSALHGNCFFFTGQRYDDQTGMYYYRHRYYEPRSGRFVSRDRLQAAESLDLFEYALNSPAYLVDPFGLESITATIEESHFVSAEWSITAAINADIFNQGCCCQFRNVRASVSSKPKSGNDTSESGGGSVAVGPDTGPNIGVGGGYNKEWGLTWEKTSFAVSDGPPPKGCCVELQVHFEVSKGENLGGWVKGNLIGVPIEGGVSNKVVKVPGNVGSGDILVKLCCNGRGESSVTGTWNGSNQGSTTGEQKEGFDNKTGKGFDGSTVYRPSGTAGRIPLEKNRDCCEKVAQPATTDGGSGDSSGGGSTRTR
jgi:RHS repeat-associated protein